MKWIVSRIRTWIIYSDVRDRELTGAVSRPVVKMVAYVGVAMILYEDGHFLLTLSV